MWGRHPCRTAWLLIALAACGTRKAANPAPRFQALSLLAGRLGGRGNLDGVGAAARFGRPAGLAFDGAGHLFVADAASHTVREITLATGAVTTLAGSAGHAGSADGTRASARFDAPCGLAYDGAGQLYVSDDDYNDDTVRRIAVATGVVTTLAGASYETSHEAISFAEGVGAAARFDGPQGLALDGRGHLYVADPGNRSIRQITLATGAVTTLAGSTGHPSSLDGIGTAAGFRAPGALTYSDGSLFALDGPDLRRIVLATRAVTTLGRYTDAAGMVADGTGHLFVTEAGTTYPAPRPARVWQVDLPSGASRVLAALPDVDVRSLGLAMHDGRLDIADQSGAVRELTLATGAMTTLAGGPAAAGSVDGKGSAAAFNAPGGLARDGAGNVYLADSDNHVVRKIDAATGEVATLAGLPGVAGDADGTGHAARFRTPNDVAFAEGALYVTDSGNNEIRRIAVDTGAVTTFAGVSRTPDGRVGSDDGRGRQARFWGPAGLAYDGAGHLYVADDGNLVVRRIDLATAEVHTIAGSATPPGDLASPISPGYRDGVGGFAELNHPRGLAYDGAGHLFLADTGSCTVRKIGVDTWLGRVGVVTVQTFAGKAHYCDHRDGAGGDAHFLNPERLAYDGAGGLYVTGMADETIRRIDLASAVVTTVAGAVGSRGVAPGLLPASLNQPAGLVFAPGPTLFVSDSAENAVLQLR